MKKLIEEDWISPEGFRCVINFHEKAGHRCGYIFIPKNDKSYVKPIYETIEISEKKINIMRYNEMYDIEVHGDLTYGKESEDDQTFPGKENRPGTWIGFDTAHYNDKPDFNTWETLLETDDDKFLFNTLKDMEDNIWGSTKNINVRKLRTFEFVKKECEDMSRQLYIMTKGQLENQND